MYNSRQLSEVRCQKSEVRCQKRENSGKMKNCGVRFGPPVADKPPAAWGILLTSGGVDGILCSDNRIER